MTPKWAKMTSMSSFETVGLYYLMNFWRLLKSRICCFDSTIHLKASIGFTDCNLFLAIFISRKLFNIQSKTQAMAKFILDSIIGFLNRIVLYFFKTFSLSFFLRLGKIALKNSLQGNSFGFEAFSYYIIKLYSSYSNFTLFDCKNLLIAVELSIEFCLSCLSIELYDYSGSKSLISPSTSFLTSTFLLHSTTTIKNWLSILATYGLTVWIFLPLIPDLFD